MLKTTLGSIRILCLFGVANCYASFTDQYHGSKIKNYDIFVMAQIWAQSNCWSLNNLWRENQTCTRCRIPKTPNNYWTLHGLWPSNLARSHPKNCENVKFSPQLLSSALKKQLNEKWPSYKLKMNNFQFWGYEYKKHGSCCLDNAETNTIEKYFSKCLDLLDEYNVGIALQEAHIVPGGSYNFNQIYFALKRHFGTNPYLHCTHYPDFYEQYIMQINLCFNKSFQLVDCAHDDGSISNCKRRNKINYPKNLKTCY